MDKITPHLWFDKEAVQAAEFYTSVFENSAITFRTTLRGTPAKESDSDRGAGARPGWLEPLHFQPAATVMTTFPFLWPPSTYRWASAICSNG
jgi:hypothetical protein